MGIKDFLKILIGGKTIMEYANIYGIKYFNGKKIVIDAFNLIYRNRYATDNLSHNGKITSHIKITLSQILMINDAGADQMWIFDSGFNPLKAETLKKRKIKITKEEIEDIKKLLQLLGVKYITVETEAEFYCAELVKSGYFDYVLSTDMDVIIRGGNILAPKSNGDYLCLHSSDLPLTTEELVKIAVMIGCDFSPKTRGIGPLTVYNRLKTEILTPRQIEAYNFMIMPLNRKVKENIKPSGDIVKLKEWLKILGFSDKTLNNLNLNRSF